MISKTLATLAISALTLRVVTAGVIDTAPAVNACNGWPSGTVKCLSDVSYTVCLGDGAGHGAEQVYFVAAGTHCEQAHDNKPDAANVLGVATATRVFSQAANPSGVKTRAPLTESYNDAQKASWFLTTATAGIARPTKNYVEPFVTAGVN